MLLQDLTEEPICYHLSEFMIDRIQQGKGYGQKALSLLLSYCRKEHRFQNVEVCVNRDDAAAIHVYQKAGFHDTGYVDQDVPNFLCMSYELPKVYADDLIFI